MTTAPQVAQELPSFSRSAVGLTRAAGVRWAKRFAGCFARWMADLSAVVGLKTIAIDGKACRSALGDTFRGCLHLVNAWTTQNNLFLGHGPRC